MEVKKWAWNIYEIGPLAHRRVRILYIFQAHFCSA